MGLRKPAVAGQFYASNQEQCFSEIRECLGDGIITVPLPESIAGGIVPHAGWVFSGTLAAMVFSAIKHVNREVDTFVIFGAAHRYVGSTGVVYQGQGWETPIGSIDIDTELADKIVETGLAMSNAQIHGPEHSIEVQVPFIQYLFPEARIVPIIVPPVSNAIDLGDEVGGIISVETKKKIVCIASTDLTHYGPRYGFYPQGTGQEALRWAKEVNDMEFIELALKMKAGRAIESAEENASACGPGAAAALISAMKRLGKTEGKLLAHTHSCEVMQSMYNQTSEESVGYAAIVY